MQSKLDKKKKQIKILNEKVISFNNIIKKNESNYQEKVSTYEKRIDEFERKVI